MAESIRRVSRDTIVIGASAGGVDAVPRIIGQLPRELAAAVVVVQHMAPHPNPMYVDIIQRRSQIAVRWVEQGDPLENGTVYVAPPGTHISIVESRFQVMGSARENRVRPSIDRVMRSAAATRGPRTIGVLLTGMLDDGVAGLVAVQDAGGYTIVQDPSAAAFSDLPRRALRALDPDRVLDLDAIAAALIRLVERVAELEPPADLRREPTPDKEVIGSRVEGAMWSAIRALQERATSFERLASDALAAGSRGTHELFQGKANEARAQVELAREFMLRLAREN